VRDWGYGQIAHDVGKAVFAVFPTQTGGATKATEGSMGTAFAVSGDGLFLTASHVLSEIENSMGDQNYELAVARDPTGLNSADIDTLVGGSVVQDFGQDADIAVLSFDVDDLTVFDHLQVRTGGGLDRMGQAVTAFGYPVNTFEEREWQLQRRTFSGVLSGIHNPSDEYGRYETDMLFNPGLSGGPLISLAHADVIGVVHGTNWRSQPLGETVVDYPVHISEAMMVTDQANNLTRGPDLESLGIDYTGN